MGLNARSFKDIVAAGDDNNVFEFLENEAPFALMGAGGISAEASVVAPSILIDDLELHQIGGRAAQTADRSRRPDLPRIVQPVNPCGF